MPWAVRHPLAPQVASIGQLGLGDGSATQAVAPGLDAAVMIAQQRRRETGRAHYVITQADAVLFSRPEYYLLDATYFPGFAVINDTGESKLPAHVTTWWWPEGSSNPSPPSTPGGSTRPPSVAVTGGNGVEPPAFAFDSALPKVLAVAGGLALGGAVVWFFTR